MQMRHVLGAVTLLGTGLVACGGEEGGDGGPGLSISQSGGGGQTGNISTTLEDSIYVLVTEGGAPQEGRTISWTAQGTAASVNPTTSVTNADGLASAAWTLGTTPGPQTARANLLGATGSPVTFQALAIGGTGVAFGDTYFRSNRNGTQDPAVDTLNLGGSMTWTGAGGNHTVRSQGTPTFTSSGPLNGNGVTYTVTFNSAGTYEYDCEIHGAAMTGRIVVLNDAP